MIVSTNDNRSYQPLTLNNGLKVLLIQDLDSEKSAVSLTVNAGHFDDPTDRQGLAHFLEHMLFLGTERFPEPGGFSQFTSQHGGNSNAWTGTEHSSYFFDIQNDYLVDALTQFAQFFISPLILPSACEKERNAIDAEFKLKLKDDTRRIYQVHKETVNPAHPFAKFSVGNKQTLANKTRCISEEIRAFFKRHYQAQFMTLAISSPLPHEQLAPTVKQLFERIHGDVRKIKPSIEAPLYLTQHLCQEIFIKPHKHMQKLIIAFALPSIDSFYQQKTVSFLAHLIGYEGTNSLYSILKAKGWINALSAGGGINGSNFKDFNISIALTDEGKSHRCEIVELFFEYLDVIKQTPTALLEKLYQDKKRLLDIAFDNQEKSRVTDWVNSLSVNMHHYPEQDYVRGDYLMTGFAPSQWQHLFRFFTPTNMRLTSIYPEVACDQFAKWYETPFAACEIPNSWLTQLENIKSNASEMEIAKVNPYLSKKIRLLEVERHLTHPELIFENDGCEFWFKQDSSYRVAKGHFYLSLDSELTVQSIKHMAMTRLFADLFMDSVAEQFYPAELAGLSYHLASHQGGLTLHTWGLSTNQYEFVDQLIEQLFNASFCEMRFNEYKKQLARHWHNGNQNKPVSMLFSHLSASLLPWNPTPQQLAEELASVSYEQFNVFKQHLFDQLHCQALLHGNWQRADADAFCHLVNTLLTQTAAIKDLQRPVLSVLENTQRSYQLEHHDNAIVVYFQSNTTSICEKVRLMLINHLISQDYFNEMRTQKQLGYLVGSGFAPLNTRAGIAFYIQSPQTDSDILATYNNQFLQQYHKSIAQLSDQQWAQAKTTLLTQIKEKDKNLRLKSQRFWLSIGNGDKKFDMQKRLEMALLQLSQVQLVDYCEKLFASESTRLTLCTEINSQNELKPAQNQNSF